MEWRRRNLMRIRKIILSPCIFNCIIQVSLAIHYYQTENCNCDLHQTTARKYLDILKKDLTKDESASG